LTQTVCLDKTASLSTEEIVMPRPVGSHERREAMGEAPPRMPRWVKVSVLVVLVIAVFLVLAMLVVDGEHGAGLHTGAADPAVLATTMAI